MTADNQIAQDMSGVHKASKKAPKSGAEGANVHHPIQADDRRNGMFEPRKWQIKAVNQCVSMAIGGSDRALVFACPGSGKTVAGLLIADGLRDRAKKSRKVIVLTPNLAIKTQWIDRSEALGIRMVALENANKLHLAVDDMFSGGFVLTYQQAIHMRASLRLFCDVHKPVVILDEVHHTAGPLGARDGNVWGVTIAYSLENACFKVCTTGTPFREGPNPIAFVDYDEKNRAHAHVEYGYKEAIHDKICRPIQFEVYDGDMEWRDANGASTVADFSSRLTKAKSRERLRAAVSLDGRFPIRMLTDAHNRLASIRREAGGERAAGMVLAMDIAHAEAIADELQDIAGSRPVVVHNKIDESINLIDGFRDGDAPWIIGVQMLSEGVDIPRLRVGVYCTNIRASLYFHQFCGRVVRVQSSAMERAYVFMPADPVLDETARQIEEEVAHALGEDTPIREPNGKGRGGRRRDGITVEDSDGQLDTSIFSGRAFPSTFLREHELAIRDFRETNRNFKSWTAIELASLMIDIGKLPQIAEAA